MQDWIWLLVGIALSSGLFALLVTLYPKLKSEKQGYPLETLIEPLLLPLIYEGICAAYRLSEQAVDEGLGRIRGMDKKAIADGIYAMLPDRIGDYEITLVKSIVTKERFEQLVQDAFDRFDRFYIEHREHFDEQFEEWKKTSAPTP
ncbi:MAG: hypothetical protein J7M16_06200 [Anaerolineae bacterium]|nr:hypothetical protein [Anaerolineae bacterium]